MVDGDGDGDDEAGVIIRGKLTPSDLSSLRIRFKPSRVDE